MAIQVENPAIFGMACTYVALDLRPFVLSLRGTGYEDTVRLGIDPNAETKKFLAKWQVAADPGPCSDQADAEHKKVQGNTYLGNLNQRRWHYYKKWLIEGKHDRVWLLDVRDVVFQAHPFRGLTNEITFFVSKPGSTTTLFANVKKCFSEEDAAEMKSSKMPTIEAGLVEGKASQIVPLCTTMLKSAQQAAKKDEGCSLSDQFLLNHYVWENDLTKPGQVVFPGMTIAERWGNSSALTLSQAECVAEGWESHYDSDGNITVAGQAVPIIHGWDKCPDYKKQVIATYRPPKQKVQAKDLLNQLQNPSLSGVKGRAIQLYESQKQLVLSFAGVLALVLAYVSYRVCRACAKPNEYAPVAVIPEEEENPLTLENKRPDDDWEVAAAPGELFTGATARIKGRAELNGKSCTIVRADPSRADVWVVRTENGELHALRTSNLVLKAGQKSSRNSAAPMPIGWTNNESDSDCN